MSADSVIRALLHAIDEDPGDADLRVHLAELLVEDDPAAALDHLRVVLQQRPDDARALAMARDAAANAGDDVLAARYAKLAAALDPSPDNRPDPGSPGSEAAVAAPEGPAAHEPLDEFDRIALLRQRPSGAVAIVAARPSSAVPGMDWQKELDELRRRQSSPRSWATSLVWPTSSAAWS